MAEREIPARLGTHHEFRMRKRSELREARKVLETARAGCAFTPTEGRIVEALRLVNEAIDLCSVKNWGR